MFAAKLSSGTAVLLASFTIASLATRSPTPAQDEAAGATAKEQQAHDLPDEIGRDGHFFKLNGPLMYVNIYATDPNSDDQVLSRFADGLVRRLGEIKGTGDVRNLGNRISLLRVRLDPERMRAQNLSLDQVKKALEPSRIIGIGDWLEEARGWVFRLSGYELVLIGLADKPEQYENIVLRVNENGEVERLKDVGRVERAATLFDISSDVNGHPAATIIVTRFLGPDAEVIGAVKDELKRIKKESFPTGMEFDAIPFDCRDMIFAVIETPHGSTLEFTQARCHELGAIARGIDEIASVTALTGWQIRTESRGSNVGTCLIHLKDSSDRTLTSRQTIEMLEEKCGTMNVHLAFFEPPAVSVFVTSSGFSVRVLDTSNSNKRPGSVPDTITIESLNRKALASLFDFLASNYPQYELVIDNDVAIRNRVSIASALDHLAIVAGASVQAEQMFRGVVEELSRSHIENDRGERLPYAAFLRLVDKLGTNDLDRKDHPAGGSEGSE